MADCPRCHAPLKPGAFTCGVCGLSVGAPPGGTAAAKRSGLGPRARWIVIGGGLVVVAAALVWFFVLRSPATSGDEFLGTWRSQSMQSIGSATVTRSGDAFAVLLTSGETAQQARVQAHLDGDRLVVKPGDFSASGDPNAGKLEWALKLLAGDFRIELSSVDPTRLLLRLSGVSPAGQSVEERTPLQKAEPSPGASP
jgi:hypothetical protein